MTKHTYFVCSCNNPGCPYCDGGLALCTVCNGMEGSLTKECPGEKLASATCDDIYTGQIDFIGGKWISISAVGGKYSEVLEPFFNMMNAELHANSRKGDRPGWLGMDRKTALLEIYYHLGKLHKAVHGNEEEAICEYAADVANMSMMLVDICGLLTPTKEKTNDNSN